MKVSACLVTRGDVDMLPIVRSLPVEWERLVWVNGQTLLRAQAGSDYVEMEHPPAPPGYWPDLSVYGRYAAIEHASGDVIYTQDDDVIVSDPQAVVDALIVEGGTHMWDDEDPGCVVCNMPPEFRPHYPDSGLVGFGAVFHRDAPARAFERMGIGGNGQPSVPWIGDMRYRTPRFDITVNADEFLRRADNVFTVLTPRILVDIPKTDLPYASDDNRMWKQPGHTGERDRMTELARRVRDA